MDEEAGPCNYWNSISQHAAPHQGRSGVSGVAIVLEGK